MRTREQRMTTVTIGCAIANIALTLAKMAAGLIGKSAAMTADAIHSLSDVVADAVVLIMVRISAKGIDVRHNWGRGKYETIATLAISILLIVIAVDLMIDGIGLIKEILAGGAAEKPGMIALWVAIISILVQEAIFRWTVHTGKAVESQTMIANAWHHRSDALASVASLIGIGGAIFLGGRWILLDPLVGCIISIVILIIALKMFFPALHELTDGALPDELVESIRKAVGSVIGESCISDVKTRKSGHCNVIEISLNLNPEMSLKEAGVITSAVKSKVIELLGSDSTVSVIV